MIEFGRKNETNSIERFIFLSNSIECHMWFILSVSANTNTFLLQQQLLESSQMLQEPQHVEIVLNDDNDDAEQIAAERDAAEHTTKKVRHRRHKRPFYRRVFNYIRTAWTGVNFSSSNGKSTNILFIPVIFSICFALVWFVLHVYCTIFSDLFNAD